MHGAALVVGGRLPPALHRAPLITPSLLHAAHKTGGGSTLLLLFSRVAEVGSLSTRAKMAINIYIYIFTIFATIASFLRVIANLHI